MKGNDFNTFGMCIMLVLVIDLTLCLSRSQKLRSLTVLNKHV